MRSNITEVEVGSIVSVDGRGWEVKIVKNGVAFMIATMRRVGENSKPSRYENVKHGLKVVS
jgi:hypothetical protein